MLLCAACNRGYHTHCVGLEAVPTGGWFCPKCPGAADRTAAPAAAADVAPWAAAAAGAAASDAAEQQQRQEQAASPTPSSLERAAALRAFGHLRAISGLVGTPQVPAAAAGAASPIRAPGSDDGADARGKAAALGRKAGAGTPTDGAAGDRAGELATLWSPRSVVAVDTAFNAGAVKSDMSSMIAALKKGAAAPTASTTTPVVSGTLDEGLLASHQFLVRPGMTRQHSFNAFDNVRQAFDTAVTCTPDFVNPFGACGRGGPSDGWSEGGPGGTAAELVDASSDMSDGSGSEEAWPGYSPGHTGLPPELLFNCSRQAVSALPFDLQPLASEVLRI